MKFWLFPLLAGFLSFCAGAQEPPVVPPLWEFTPPDKCSDSSPALAPDGTIYLGTFHGWLRAFTPAGDEKWKFKAGREIKSSPAVGADGTIYFGARDWKFYAVSPQGKLKWTFATGAWVDSSPAIATDGTVYFGSWDANFYALNPDGSPKWKFATGSIVSASPAIAVDGTIYFGSHDKNFYALAPDGKLKWKFATGAEVTASPAIGADGTVYFSSTDGNFYALKPDGTEQWRQHTGGYTEAATVVVEAGNLYFGAAGQQTSLDATGKVRWHFPAYMSPNTTAAVTAKNEVFLITPWQSGLLTTDEKFQWRSQTGRTLCAPPNLGPQGVVYFTDWQKLYAFQPATNAAPPAKSSWPLWRANPQHTGRVGK
ncbi:MAG TPA: PQQ-binding-like beta-propeller repeat protein [Verrucomicrobiae bacterium]